MINLSASATFTSAGKFNIAAIYSINADVNYGLFTQAAVNLVNKGHWFPDFSSKYFFVIFDNDDLLIHTVLFIMVAK